MKRFYEFSVLSFWFSVLRFEFPMPHSLLLRHFQQVWLHNGELILCMASQDVAKSATARVQPEAAGMVGVVAKRKFGL